MANIANPVDASMRVNIAKPIAASVRPPAMTNAGRIRRTSSGASIEPTTKRERPGHGPQAAAERRQAEHQLQVLRQEEEAAERKQDRKAVRRQRRAEAPAS